ncbi:hypothetical protein [Ruegeria hyattellae]|uniref:hypothetical protein n=1 Tax=Ruegeria hyattellae TaxID=3233337 RepID=UPI00355C4EAF
MLTEEDRAAHLLGLKAKMRELEVLFEETESRLGELTVEEKSHLKGLASAIEYQASKLKA